MNGPAVTGPFGLSAALSEREQAGLLRSRIATDGASGGRLRVAGRDYLNLSANDYLGLADHPAIKTAFQEGIDRYGAGAGASPLVTGYSRAHQQLEETLADWLGLEAVLLFNCGFSANQAVLKALLGKEHLLWQDKLNHASLQEMGSQLPCKMKRFGHNDMTALERQLEPSRGLIVSEGVFSMDGDQGPWRELAALAAQSGNWLMIDDAHGLGVLGPQGAGHPGGAGVNPASVHIQMGTFGKALGVAGAFVGGSRELVAYLVNFARHYVYSTHMPAAQACAVRQSIALVRAADEARAQLGQLITRFRQGAEALGWQLGASATPIQPLLVGESGAALQLAERLRERGVWAGAIRPPTVPVGTARLRITLSAAHSEQDVDRLLDALGPCPADNERGAPMLHERFQVVDKAQLARRFGAAARHYDAHARFQQEVGLALLERMPDRQVGTDLTVSGLDLGCGTGFFLPALVGRCSELTGLDLAPGMLAQAALRGSGARLLCGDAEQLPFADETFDWVFSSLALQWCERPAQAFAELHRVLKPGGRLLFSTLLAESLWQLREAWRTVDECDHVNRFLSLPQLQHAIAAGGFAAPALESLTWSLGYPELNGLLRDLKGIGANQVNDERHTGLSSRQRLQRLSLAYEAHRQPDGLLAASYQVCLGQLIRR